MGVFAGAQESIKGIATKEKDYDVARWPATCSRAWKRRGEVDPAAYVSIYKSERFPPATIGYAYNLSPELREA